MTYTAKGPQVYVRRWPVWDRLAHFVSYFGTYMITKRSLQICCCLLLLLLKVAAFKDTTYTDKLTTRNTDHFPILNAVTNTSRCMLNLKVIRWSDEWRHYEWNILRNSEWRNSGLDWKPSEYYRSAVNKTSTWFSHMTIRTLNSGSWTNQQTNIQTLIP